MIDSVYFNATNLNLQIRRITSMASPIISRIQANVFAAQYIVIDDKYEHTVLNKNFRPSTMDQLVLGEVM